MLDKAKNRGVLRPYLRNPDVRWFDISTTNLRMMAFEDHEIDRFSLKPGDVVLCEGGEAGRAGIWTNEISTVMIQKALHRVRCGPHLYNRFLVHRLMYDFFDGALAEYYTGATIKHLTGQDLARYEFPLPPLDEQRRLAAILDQADDLRRKRRHALEKLNALSLAIFQEMFGDQIGETGGFVVRNLRELSTKIGSGATPIGGEASYQTEGVALIRSMNVRDGVFSTRGLAFLSTQQAAKLNIVVVQDNDLLINITGASVARVCRAPSSVLPARVNQHVSIIRPTEEVSAEFLEAFLLTPKIKHKLLSIAQSGATRQAITKSALEQFEIPVPPRELQREFARKISCVIELKATHATSSHAFEQLFASLQHHAFSGTLALSATLESFESVQHGSRGARLAVR